MPDIQQQTDVEQARARIEDAAARKQAQEEQNGAPPAESVTITPAVPQERRIRPISAKPKKKPFGQKLKEAFFGDDIGDGTITEHIFFRIFIPSIKRLIADMGNSAINMALGLDPKTRTIRTGETHVSNAGVYRDRNLTRSYGYPQGNARAAISEYEWDEEAAKDIYNQLGELIDKFGNASVADAYSIMGMGDRIRTVDRNWGWTSMRNAEVYPIDAAGERWVVDMPPAKPI